MKIQAKPLSVVILALFLSGWVDCTNRPACASMRSWFPGTNPLALADNLPYQLSVTGNAYIPGSTHTVYLNGSMTNEMKMRSFVGFLVYAENSVTEYPNGRFVAEDLPSGVEEVNCSHLYIVQNSSSSENWTSIKLLWKAPKDGHLAGNITFRASAIMQTSPQLSYFEGFTAHLRYECPVFKCMPCPSGSIYLRDSYGCPTCQCGGICANTTCPFYGYCHPSKDQKTAECKCDFVCAAVYKPVCGSDGKTHGNECGMRSTACVQKKTITVAYEGECSTGSVVSAFSRLSLVLTVLVFLWFSA